MLTKSPASNRTSEVLLLP